jgi:hypothetical protein
MFPKFRIVCVFLFATIFSSCWTTAKFLERAKYDMSKVPNDFDPRKHVLLVSEIARLNYPDQRSDEKTEQIDKLLQQYYPYKYEIVSLNDIYTNYTKYGDTSKYKYALLYYTSSITSTTTTKTTIKDNTGTHSSSVSPSAKTTYIDFGFYDRVTKATYPATGNRAPKGEYAVAAFAELVEKAKSRKK